jgi:hypothetical protein
MARIAAIVVLAVLAAMPAAASAAPSGSGGGLQQQAPAQPAPAPAPEQSLLQTPEQEAPAPAPEPVTTTDSGTIDRADLLLIVLVIAALMAGIWYVIARDARRATAGRVRTEPAGGVGGSATRAGRRSRKLSADERRRRKRGRAH